MRVQTHMPQRVAEYLARLQSGERNPWLVYEVCKIIQPTSLEALAAVMPWVPEGLLADGWEEWRRTRCQTGS